MTSIKVNIEPSNSITKPTAIVDLTDGSSYFVREIKPCETATSPPSDSVGEQPKTIIDLTQGSFPYSVQEIKPPSNSIAKPKTLIDLTQGFPYSVRKIDALNNEIPKKRSRRSITKVSCDICADSKLKKDMFAIVGCGHSYCSECVGKYVDSKLQENVVLISCPFLGCNGSLEPNNNCQKVLPKKVFDRWCDALCESLIVGEEKFYCPFNDCSALLIKASKVRASSKCECPECHRLFCAKCKVPWHLSLKCNEYQKLKEDERSSEDILLMDLAKNEKWIRCSNCGFYVQRSDGCLLMKCRCGHGFCYNCGAPMERHYCENCKH